MMQVYQKSSEGSKNSERKAKKNRTHLWTFMDIHGHIHGLPQNSNINSQIILGAHSCASYYVVDFVTKSNRGMSNLQRKLLRIYDGNPVFDRELRLRYPLLILKRDTGHDNEGV